MKPFGKNTMVVGGVAHEKDNTFNYHTAKELDLTKSHPLGTVYEKDGFGYVANGYDWWKFPVEKLQEINDNH